MRVPKYRLHKASGQAVITLKGKDQYLGKYGSEESRAKYRAIVSEIESQRAKIKAKKVSQGKIGPGYRLHGSSGQAVVTIGGRDYYLGKHGSPESFSKYHRLFSEWLASGRSAAFGMPQDAVTVTSLIAAFVRHAEAYYGTGYRSELERFKPVLKVLRKLYGTELASNFGPIQYEAVRIALLNPYTLKRRDGTKEKRYRSRTYINSQMKRLRFVFRWAASKSLVPVSVFETLRTIAPLKAGRTSAPEREPVKPVSDEIVNATLPHLNHVVRAMVEFQRLVGCRPGEVCKIKPSMVDRSGDVWEIHLDKHKTAHRGKQRVIYVGPQAQEILKPFLLRGADDYCFSPAEADKRRREEIHEARVTPMNEGNKPGSNVKRKPARTPGDHYKTQSYGRSIKYACESNGIEVWAPNRLRHSAGTRYRKEFGLEAASVILGHSEVGVTQVYAEADRAKAIEAARRIG